MSELFPENEKVKLPDTWSKEGVYWGQLSKHIEAIAEICEKNKIPHVMALQIGSNRGVGNIAISFRVFNGTSEEIYKAADAFSVGGKSFLKAVRDGDIKPGGPG